VFIDFLLAFRFFIDFSMVFSDFSMMFIDFPWFSFIFLWFVVIFQRYSLSLCWVFIDVSNVFIYVFIVYRFCTGLLQWFLLIFMCSMVWSLKIKT
jgi:hypothetical protein